MDSMQSIARILEQVGTFLWGWPLTVLFVIAACVFTYVFRGVQVYHFFDAWRTIVSPEDGGSSEVSPLQAFMATLSTAMGNGSLAGMATAIYTGGPGAAFWVLVLVVVAMPIRFAEIFGATTCDHPDGDVAVGGPNAYLAHMPCGRVLAMVYMVFCLLFSFITGNAMQCNSITLGVTGLTGLPKWVTAAALCAFLVYVVCGGARRIMRFSERISPLKVILFMTATLAVIVYNITAIPQALTTMVSAAFQCKAAAGGLVGYTCKEALQMGLSRTLSAAEVGIGNAGIVFGSTQTRNPFRVSLMSMASTCIAVFVCFLMMLAFLVAGTWESGLTSTPLVMATYASVFGSLGSFVATLLSAMFGIGVLVAYAFVGLQCWRTVISTSCDWLYFILYCIVGFVGSIATVDVVWGLIDIAAAALLTLNLLGLLWISPRMARAYRTRKVSG